MVLKVPRLKTILLTPLALFAVFYLFGAIVFSFKNTEAITPAQPFNTPITVAVFGASGTAGDGILKAALASSGIDKIYVITRRETPRMSEGIANSKVQMILHTDYLDYSEIVHQLRDIDSVFWAIGITSIGTDEKTYGMIHTDFPLAFVKAWQSASIKDDTSFHFISSSDISEKSNTMWVREKIRAEKTLFDFAEGSNLRVVAYRPDYIGPTKEEANLGQTVLYWFFKPVGAAVKATQIGQAMINLAIRGKEIKNGETISTLKILQYSQTEVERDKQ